MRSVRWCVAGIVIAHAACGGGSPAAPSERPQAGGGLPFVQTAYAITFSGDSVACGDVKNPQAGVSVAVRMTLRADATGWTAAHESESLTLRLEPGPAPPLPSGPFAIGLTGTVRGSAEDEGVLFDPNFSIPRNGTRITFADDSAVTGVIPSPQLSDFSQGAVNATVTFSRNGVASTCPSGVVHWSINRRQP